MTDKAKIRAEIERRYNERDKIGDNIRANVHKSLISFIDSMQEEPVSNPIDFEKELYKAFGQVKDFTLGMRIAKRFYDMGKNSQEPVSEDLEEAGKKWLSPQLDKSYAAYGETKQMELTHFDGYAMLDAIEFGAQWQQAKDSIPAEYLEEAVNAYIGYPPEVDESSSTYGKRQAFKAGAKWQKQKDSIVSDDLKKAAENYAFTMSGEDEVLKYDAFIEGAQWQKEQIIVNTADATIGLPYENKNGGYTHLIDVSRPLPVGNNKIAIIFKKD